MWRHISIYFFMIDQNLYDISWMLDVILVKLFIQGWWRRYRAKESTTTNNKAKFNFSSTWIRMEPRKTGFNQLHNTTSRYRQSAPAPKGLIFSGPFYSYDLFLVICSLRQGNNWSKCCWRSRPSLNYISLYAHLFRKNISQSIYWSILKGWDPSALL